MDFKYNIKNRKLSSKNLTKIKDKSENLFEINGFLLDPQTNKIIGKKIKFVDEEKNNYFLKDVMINTLHKEVFGTDINVKLNKEIFDNNENDPRISARSIKIKNKSSTLKKVFLLPVVMTMIVLHGAFMQKKLSTIRKQKL